MSWPESSFRFFLFGQHSTRERDSEHRINKIRVLGKKLTAVKVPVKAGRLVKGSRAQVGYTETLN